MSGTVSPNRYRYQLIPPSTVAVPLGINGGAGDYLHRLIINIATPGTADVTLLDGVTIIPVVTGAAQLQRGPQSIEFNIASRNGPFRLTTGAGASVLAIGVTGT